MLNKAFKTEGLDILLLIAVKYWKFVLAVDIVVYFCN